MNAPALFRINVEVGDLESATSFYSELFEQEPRPDMGHRFYVRAGPVILQVVEAAQPHPAAKALYFSVSDLDEVHRRAADLHCLATGEVHGTAAGEPLVRPWGERSFYAEDPWGNPLCFVQEGTTYGA